MSAPALPTVCPRCLRRLVRNHDELVCLTHGQVFEPVRAWETATSPDIDTPFGRQPRTRSPKAIPWTNEERELWRRAEAGEEFAPPEPEEEEPMSEFAPKSADDLGGPALARLRELAAQVEKADALARSLRAEALRFVQVLDLLGVDIAINHDREAVAMHALATPASWGSSAVNDTSDSRYSCLSIFSGACGLDVGLEQTGRFKLLGCLESNPVFANTIRRNRDAGRLGHLQMPVFEGDIRAIPPEVVMEACGISPGQLDVLVGGPPCQSFSTTGRRRTVQDPRGELLWDYLRYVAAIRPKVFLMENVRGLLSAALSHRPIANRPDKGGPPLTAEEQPGSVIDLWADDLISESSGDYRVDCFEVNAVNYGAPQLRERALFLGNRLGLLLDFPPPTHGPSRGGHQASLFGSLQPFRTLRDAIGSIREESKILLDFSPRKKGFLEMVPPGGNWRALPVEVQQESMGKAWYAKGGRSGWWRRLSWDLPCPTIVTMPNHASTSMCHPDEIRVLSLKECALIQEFPNDWEFAGTVQQRYEQVGNAVPTRLGFVAGQTIANALDLACGGDERRQFLSRAAAAFAPPLRRVYLSSHVRTRSWYRGGEVFIWDDDADQQEAEYKPGRR